MDHSTDCSSEGIPPNPSLGERGADPAKCRVPPLSRAAPAPTEQRQCPAQCSAELISAKETPFLCRHFSGQTSSRLPATLPQLEEVILECLSLLLFAL